MRLTVYSDYSLRMLMYLALRPERLATIEEIASAYGISRAHLMKVAHQLGQMGFVSTVRGKGGGLRLAREPITIGLGDVVRHTEPDFALVPCLSPGDGSCVIQPSCVLRHAIEQARDAFLSVLDCYTLADLTRPRGPLLGLLQIAPQPGVASIQRRISPPT
ncbi:MULTISPECIES: RrF2 family transcriptional regulator [Sphingosinicellaceae]|uniref:RrF2 family transcriptional regulator n=1 Tax=Sphingosinicellaceae TaxID=2820280 RepID=UPI001C1E4B59|nr:MULTISPECIES: Rrf2 family transcriptional regulator [Polymorphobacter]QYE33422.1 Rrf2 family transcriptional regulator [Polymorphobacter sp. PAMC 29334]UAJ12519.1 Rrf2 family transcriptional regulator [Polymorphobacter megasporae]